MYFPLVGPKPRSWVIFVAGLRDQDRAGGDHRRRRARDLVREVAPEAPMYRAFTMAGLARDSMVQLTFTMLTLGVASVLALVLGAVGLYGVLSYVVAERTREIGVRMALGAQAEQVRRMVVGRDARGRASASLLGIVAALRRTRALGTPAVRRDGGGCGDVRGDGRVMIAVGLLASYLPARRASNVDPIVSLRGE